MPPVAETETTEWGKALAAALRANQEREDKPHSWFALSRALAKLEPKIQPDSWLSTIKRIRSGKLVPAEERAQMIAAALDVPRDRLPESSEPLTLRILQHRLAEAVAALNVVGQRLDAFDQRLDDLERRSPAKTGQEQTP